MANTTNDTGSASAGEVPLERIETELTELAGRIASATCGWLLAVAEYDRREGWGVWGCKSMVHWLGWRCGVAPVTARDQVRVARRLAGLPAITEAFRAGRLSYSQVRALTRVAQPETEVRLVELARSCTAGQLDRIVGAWDRVRAAGDDDPMRALERRGVWDRGGDDGTVTLTVRLPAEWARALLTAIDAEVGVALAERRAAADASEGVGAGDRLDHPAGRRADALVALVARASGAADAPLAGQALTVLHRDAPDADEGRCHVDGHAVSTEAGKRVACDSQTLGVTDQPDGTSVDTGQFRRVPSAGLRRALWTRDRGCVFPGCATRGGLHAHHVRHWADGGQTTLDNLALLCGHHHHRVHEGGWGMEPAPGPADADRLRACPSTRWAFARPSGRPVPAVSTLPDLAEPGLPIDPDIGPETIRSEWDGTRLDTWGLSCVIDSLLHGNASAEAPADDGEEPRPPTAK